MKYKLKTIFFLVLVIALALVFVLKQIRLPRRVIEVRNVVESTEIGCSRIDLLKRLGFKGSPRSSSLNDVNPQWPHFLVETWDITPNYQVFISYNTKGKEIVFQDAVLWDSKFDPIPDGEFRRIWGEVNKGSNGNGVWTMEDLKQNNTPSTNGEWVIDEQE